MTSSLVGSEDVYKRQPFKSTTMTRLVRISRGRRGVPTMVATTAARMISVSYTHLTLPTICSV
eukprot:10525036-Prorocentrum_lima.AAC.1